MKPPSPRAPACASIASLGPSFPSIPGSKRPRQELRKAKPHPSHCELNLELSRAPCRPSRAIVKSSRQDTAGTSRHWPQRPWWPSARVLPFFFGSQTLHLWPRLLWRHRRQIERHDLTSAIPYPGYGIIIPYPSHPPAPRPASLLRLPDPDFFPPRGIPAPIRWYFRLGFVVSPRHLLPILWFAGFFCLHVRCAEH
jgi:hypothetical protein